MQPWTQPSYVAAAVHVQAWSWMSQDGCRSTLVEARSFQPRWAASYSLGFNIDAKASSA